MKKTLNLPQNKKEELEKIKNLILKEGKDVQMIILFGSYARGTYKETKDLAPDRKSGAPSDYDILVVTSTKENALKPIWSNLGSKTYRIKLGLSAYVRIIAHDIYDINKKLFEGQYFYSDIKKEGIMLYDNGKFELGEKGELDAKYQKEIAQRDYDYWFERSKGFYGSYEFDFNRKEYELGAFHLHQVCESAYKAILLVFTNYCPQEHLLKDLGEGAEECSEKLENIFPYNTKEEKDLFDLLDYAYIGGRYDPNFKVTKEQLQILENYVKQLLKITEEICTKKINDFK